MNLESGLILDIITGAILLVSAIFGARKGFTRTLVSFVSWFLCVVLGFVFLNKITEYICTQTSLDDFVNNAIISSVGESITESNAYQAIPDLFSSLVDDSISDIIYATSASLTGIIVSIISFLAVVIVIKLICFIILHLFSKKHNDGALGFFDGLCGFIFGLTRGVIIVLIFFAMLVPVLGLAFPDLSAKILGSMETSYVAKYLYHDNALLMIIKEFFS